MNIEFRGNHSSASETAPPALMSPERPDDGTAIDNRIPREEEASPPACTIIPQVYAADPVAYHTDIKLGALPRRSVADRNFPGIGSFRKYQQHRSRAVAYELPQQPHLPSGNVFPPEHQADNSAQPVLFDVFDPGLYDSQPPKRLPVHTVHTAAQPARSRLISPGQLPLELDIRWPISLGEVEDWLTDPKTGIVTFLDLRQASPYVDMAGQAIELTNHQADFRFSTFADMQRSKENGNYYLLHPEDAEHLKYSDDQPAGKLYERLEQLLDYEVDQPAGHVHRFFDRLLGN